MSTWRGRQLGGSWRLSSPMRQPLPRLLAERWVLTHVWAYSRKSGVKNLGVGKIGERRDGWLGVVAAPLPRYGTRCASDCRGRWRAPQVSYSLSSLFNIILADHSLQLAEDKVVV